MHVIDQINPWCDDSIYALPQNTVHVLVPYTSMNKEHFDNVKMTKNWHNIVTDTRPWYNPLGGNLEQRKAGERTVPAEATRYSVQTLRILFIYNICFCRHVRTTAIVQMFH